ncbi:uncharacterized protein LOC133535715 [Nerophis ophidion]|uniref:uncharacterized protein LOC133535715 n=1 Tax=Nerophis ophidion TaxID=159077 RepID=UPI002ADF1EBB|nr:uncharacterized protein LOC133535715 [Nerophis ophidion]
MSPPTPAEELPAPLAPLTPADEPPALLAPPMLADEPPALLGPPTPADEPPAPLALPTLADAMFYLLSSSLIPNPVIWVVLDLSLEGELCVAGESQLRLTPVDLPQSPPSTPVGQQSPPSTPGGPVDDINPGSAHGFANVSSIVASATSIWHDATVAAIPWATALPIAAAFNSSS